VASQVFSSSIASGTNVIARAAPDVTALSAAQVFAASASAKIQIPAPSPKLPPPPIVALLVGSERCVSHGEAGEAAADRGRACYALTPHAVGTREQGLTQVHFSAQPEPFLTENTL